MYVLLFSNVTFVITVTTYLFETKHHKYNFRKKNSTVSACQKLVDWENIDSFVTLSTPSGNGTMSVY